MDQFSSFRLFIRLVETRSLTRAAADLEIPRSIANKLLADLEMRLGEKLVKDSRDFRLTSEGKRYYGEIRPLMAQIGVVGAAHSQALSRPLH